MEPPSLGWIEIVALLGSAQGILLALALAARRSNVTANRILGLAMVSFSMFLLSAPYYAAAYHEIWPHFIGVSYALPLFFGPILYLYALSVSDSSRRFRRRDLLHFAPFLALMLYMMPFYLSSGAEKLAFFERMDLGDRPSDLVIIDNLKLLHGVIYTVLAVFVLKRHRKAVKDSFSAIERVNLRWLWTITLALVIVWGLAVSIHLFEVTTSIDIEAFDGILALAIAIFVYTAGYIGLRQPEILVVGPEPALGEVSDPPSGTRETAPVDSALESGTAPRYEKSGLASDKAEAIRDRLIEHLSSAKPYKKCDLTLSELARQLDLTPHNLSEVINTRIGLSFYDFVNGYRIEEVKRSMANPANRDATILALALEAGFNSKSSFNAIFKKREGVTPSEYRRRALHPSRSPT